MKRLYIRLIVISVLMYSLPVKADSFGNVAFGDNYVVYTSVGKLNIITLNEDGSFNKTENTALPASYSEITIKDNKIFVLWHNKLLIYEAINYKKLKLLSSSVVQKTLQEIIIDENIETKNRIINSHGDWVPRNGTCLTKKDAIFCLVYSNASRSGKGWSLNYNFKFLVSMTSNGETKSVLTLNNTYETIH